MAQTVYGCIATTMPLVSQKIALGSSQQPSFSTRTVILILLFFEGYGQHTDLLNGSEDTVELVNSDIDRAILASALQNYLVIY